MHQTYWINDTSLPEEICDIIIKQIEEDEEFGPMQYGTVSGSRHRKELRNSGVKLFPGTTWIGGMLAHYVNVANNTCFEYDMSDMWVDNTIQYTSYKGEEHYTWHNDEHQANRNDFGRRISHIRKLSISMQLSDEDDYEGGELQLAFPKYSECVEDPQYNIITVPKKRGTVVVFPSYTLHCVKPVTKGTRRSLVGWMMGVPFK